MGKDWIVTKSLAMKIINSILVPTDFSACAENAYQFSLRLADVWQSSIKLLHVILPNYGTVERPVVVDYAKLENKEDAHDWLVKFKEAGLANARPELLETPRVTQELKVSLLPQLAIGTALEASEFDLVVVGTHSSHTYWEKTWGTHASMVMRQAHCHVLVVPEEADYRGFSVVGFAANLRATDPYHLWKTCQMLAPFQPSFHCVHIERGNTADGRQLDLEELESFFFQHAENYPITFHALQVASVVEGLEVFVKDWGLDLLVMPCQHRDFFSQLFHKRMTTQMAQQTKLPLLVVR